MLLVSRSVISVWSMCLFSSVAGTVSSMSTSVLSIVNMSKLQFPVMGIETPRWPDTAGRWRCDNSPGQPTLTTSRGNTIIILNISLLCIKCWWLVGTVESFLMKSDATSSITLCFNFYGQYAYKVYTCLQSFQEMQHLFWSAAMNFI